MLLVHHLLEDRPMPHVLRSDASVRDASRFLCEKQIGGAPVVDNGRLVGFCSERDLVFRVIAQSRDPDSTFVRDIMTRDVITATPDDSILACEDMLRAAHCRHLPVVKGSYVVGCLSMREFLRADLRDREQQVRELTEYIRSAGA